MAISSSAAAPIPAPLPGVLAAPLPGSLRDDIKVDDTSNGDVILPPIPPKIIDKDEVYIGIPTSYLGCMGRVWIRKCCIQKYNFARANQNLPNPNIGYWFDNSQWRMKQNDFDAIKHKSPVIGHIYNQYLLCDKGEMVHTIYEHYKSKTWDFVPLTYVIYYDYKKHEFILNDKDLIKNIRNTNIKKRMCSYNILYVHDLIITYILIHDIFLDEAWICKSSYGSLGTSVHIYKGNDINDLHDYICAKFDPYHWLGMAARKAIKLRCVYIY